MGYVIVRFAAPAHRHYWTEHGWRAATVHVFRSKRRARETQARVRGSSAVWSERELDAKWARLEVGTPDMEWVPE